MNKNKFYNIAFIIDVLVCFFVIAEWTYFWWTNNGLHTSRWDFMLLHPVHFAVSISLMIVLYIIAIIFATLSKKS